MDNQQGPTVEHRELCSMLCGGLDGRGLWGRMDTCVCMAESFCCSLEDITTSLTGYTPIQNKKFKVWEEFSHKFFKVFFILLFSSGTSFTFLLVCSMIPYRSPRLYSFLFIPFLGSGLPRWLSSKESDCNAGAAGRCRFDLWVGKIPWRRERLPTPAWEIPWTEEPGGLQSMRSQESDRLEQLSLSYLRFHSVLICCWCPHLSESPEQISPELPLDAYWGQPCFFSAILFLYLVFLQMDFFLATQMTLFVPSCLALLWFLLFSLFFSLARFHSELSNFIFL